MVDDSAVGRAWLESVVEDAGAQAISCESLGAANRALDAGPKLALAVLDLDLDGDSSVPLATRLGATVPIAFFTSAPDRVPDPIRVRGAAIFDKARDQTALAQWIARRLEDAGDPARARD